MCINPNAISSHPVYNPKQATTTWSTKYTNINQKNTHTQPAISQMFYKWESFILITHWNKQINNNCNELNSYIHLLVIEWLI